MNILFGLYLPDAGEIYINEKKASITNPNDAYALGLGMVHQHFMLVNQLTVLENIILGKESGGFLLNRKESSKKVEELVAQVSQLPHIRICGLMTIAPFVENPEENRIYFNRLRNIAVDIERKKSDYVIMSILSMGMTNDYQVAIEEGATMVRVGT